MSNKINILITKNSEKSKLFEEEQAFVDKEEFEEAEEGILSPEGVINQALELINDFASQLPGNFQFKGEEARRVTAIVAPEVDKNIKSGAEFKKEDLVDLVKRAFNERGRGLV